MNTHLDDISKILNALPKTAAPDDFEHRLRDRIGSTRRNDVHPMGRRRPVLAAHPYSIAASVLLLLLAAYVVTRINLIDRSRLTAAHPDSTVQTGTTETPGNNFPGPKSSKNKLPVRASNLQNDRSNSIITHRNTRTSEREAADRENTHEDRSPVIHRMAAPTPTGTTVNLQPGPLPPVSTNPAPGLQQTVTGEFSREAFAPQQARKPISLSGRTGFNRMMNVQSEFLISDSIARKDSLRRDSLRLDSLKKLQKIPHH